MLLGTLSLLALHLADKVSPALFLFLYYHNAIVCVLMTAVVDSTLPGLPLSSSTRLPTKYHINIYTAMDAGMEILTDNQSSEHKELI